MRIAVDASSAVTGGGVTYLRELLPRLRDMPGLDVGPLLLRAAPADQIDGSVLGGASVHRTEHRLGALQPAWTRAVITARCDVVFSLTELGYAPRGVKLVTMARNPSLGSSRLDEYGLRMRTRFLVHRSIARRVGTHASLCLAVSDYARDIAMKSLRIHPTRVRTVYHGANLPAGGVSRRSPGGRRLLYVSNLYRYKNVHRLLRALHRMTDDTVLDVVGRPLEGDYFAELRSLSSQLKLDDRVRFLGHQSGDQLASLYTEADCFVWPSYAETFGHPLLEAYSAGLPIVASDIAVTREILGDAGSYFDPFDPSHMSEQIDRTLTGKISVGDLPRLYSWDTCASQTEAALRALL